MDQGVVPDIKGFNDDDNEKMENELLKQSKDDLNKDASRGSTERVIESISTSSLGERTQKQTEDSGIKNIEQEMKHKPNLEGGKI